MLSLLLLVLGFMPIAADPIWQLCGSSGNYTAKSAYQENLELLSATLPKNASSTPTLYAKGSIGAAPDTVYGLALCRGDTINASACGECVVTAFQDAQQLCRFNKDVTVFYDPCILRFSNQNLMNTSWANSSVLILMNTQNITEPMLPGWDPGNAESANIIVDIIMGLLKETATLAALNSPKRYATGLMDVSSTFPRLYSMTQCTPDMASADCLTCLEAIIGMSRKYFTGRQGGQILGVRCSFRYEIYSFYEGQPMRRIGWQGAAVPRTTNTTAPPPPLAVVPSQKHKSAHHGLACATGRL